MAKYKRKPEVIEAVSYEAGMEDGYACYEIMGKFIGFYRKDGPLPKVNRKPAIKIGTEWVEIGYNDYIVTDINGKRSLISAEELDREFIKVK